MRREHVFAFARMLDGQQAIIGVPRLVATLVSEGDALPIGERVWGDTRLGLPPNGPRMFRQVLTSECIRAGGDADNAYLALADVFARFPVAVVEGR